MLVRSTLLVMFVSGFMNLVFPLPDGKAAERSVVDVRTAVTHYSSANWYVWYRCGHSRWQAIGPMSYYHAARTADDYRGQGCSAYVSQ